MEMSGQLHVPGHFIPGEGASSIHGIGGWMGLRADLNDIVHSEWIL
jgi:hypothetical protein